MCALQVRTRQGVFFDRDEDEALAARRVFAPGSPGGKEVVAQAETGFQDREAGAALPALGQAVAGQEDMPRLGKGAARGKAAYKFASPTDCWLAVRGQP